MSALEKSALWPFAEYAAGLHPEGLPSDVLHAAKRCLLDWFAATLPGTVIAPATLLTAAFQDCIHEPGGRGGARLYPSGETTDARTAAFIHGAASHTVEFDDIYRNAIYHPGVPVISAALAVAQARGVSGAHLLTGIVAGYEVSDRLGAAVNPAHYEFWHTTGTIGTFGAAAAAANILGLTAEQTLHALANAGTLAAGLQQAFRADAMAKPLHGSHAAERGVTVALAAEQGVTGAPDILEGPRGFGAAMCLNGMADAQPDWAKAASTLGTDYLIKQTTTKNHAACGHSHAAIDGVLELAKAHDLTPADVRQIRVGSYQKAEEICGNWNPQTPYEAKFSLPYCCAAALVWGSVRMAAFTPERLNDPQVRALMPLIGLKTDPERQAAFPALRSANVEIETIDGRVLTHFAPTRKGDPDAPLSDAELEDKFRELASDVLGQAGAESLLAAIWSIDAMGNSRDLVAAPAQAAQ
ncbi:MAG: 2-methylcitrate dehydratase [Rhodospirillales bacterium CG15_BIG_FIL_POST_REV_8_21_14_020_66_15]|nr:MAG: 2-methylcitrate dehydratase [Rhodospirillales bacterium CG15_BIG_FIL_POST_REV_8_21_14_020_66_15]